MALNDIKVLKENSEGTFDEYILPTPEVKLSEATPKTTIVDADSISGVDSEATNATTRWTWANIKSFLSGVFITVSQATAQTIGSTGSRLTKLWATDITVTNVIDGVISKAQKLVGGNSTTLKGSIPYQSDTDTTTMLAPNTTTTKKFFSETGSGTNGNAPTWERVTASDLVASTFTVGEYSIKLKSGLSSEGKWSGITTTGTAAATLVFGDLCYLTSSGTWNLARANSASTSGGVKLGMCVLAAAGSGAATEILLYGNINASTKFPVLTVGAVCYVSSATPGLITAGAPGDTTGQSTTTNHIVRIVGDANSADELFFHPDSSFVTIA